MNAPAMVTVAIGLGSNLDDPAAQVGRALRELDLLPGSKLLKASGLYRSRALLAPDATEPQPDYCNAVALLQTSLPPARLLDALREIEIAHGRERHRRWAARTLDLDILTYGDLRQNAPELTIHHPRMTERNFVMFPLRDIAAELEIPGEGRAVDCAARLTDAGLAPWH